MIKLDFDGGKYTVIYDDTKGTMEALRYDEPWRDLTGDNLVFWMLHEIIALKDELLEYREN